MDKIRWGIIGCGDVCKVKSGPAFYKSEHSSLVAVMRRDNQKAKDFALRHGVPSYYSEADKIILNPDIDAVYIATPPESHKEYAIKAMRAGKTVYVEKPMAMNYPECLEMLKVAEETNRKLFVAYYRRTLPYFLKVKELLDNNELGKLQTVTIQYSRAPLPSDKNVESHSWRVKKEIAGGGYFYDMAPHTLDILDFLLGEITEAKGFSANLGNLYPVEDTVSAIFRFQSGIQGTGQWNYAGAEGEEKDIVEINGEKGYIRFNTFAFKPIELATHRGREFYTTEHPQHIQQPLIQSIIEELRGNGKCPSTGVSGARTSRVIDKIMGKM
ncbi:MAG: Gfo/Idh/MocA family oxidoreductase [Candidatus Azobacteroides sp.]|nr:Gfo/Idh/MocA family oxidoreductase [Candidatus Azobacteroides sp.]